MGLRKLKKFMKFTNSSIVLSKEDFGIITKILLEMS